MLADRSLRILLLNQYYPPGLAPTGRVLHDLASVLVARGHEVRAVCSRQEYSGGAAGPLPATLDGVTVRRVPAFGYGRRSAIGRVLNYASYLGLGLGECLISRWRPDVVLALTTPPYLGLFARGVASLRRGALVHWVMDLYPDSMIADGMLSAEGLTAGLLRAMTRAQFRGARGILALGDFMAARTRRYVLSGDVTVVPLWNVGAATVDPASVARVRAERGWKASDVVFLYSGNMGRGHSFATFLAAAERLGARGPVWAFAGDGYRRREVEAFARAHPGARIQLLPYVASEHVAESLSAADVHLVSLAESWDGVMVPSKLQAAFGLGRPVLFVGGRRNEPAAWIAESGGGWQVSEGDVDGLLAAAAQARDAAERSRRGAAALAFARERFDRETHCTRIAAWIEHIARKPTP